MPATPSTLELSRPFLTENASKGVPVKIDLYQRAQSATLGGFPNQLNVDSMHCETSRTGYIAMGQPIEITRTELSAEDLRAYAVRSANGAMVRRLLALALLLDGYARETAAKPNGMTRQTLRDWVRRFNAGGVAGLRSRTSPGRSPLLTDVRMAELKAIAIEGPDPERHKVVRWRRVDLCEEIASRWSVEVCEQTVGRWLRQFGTTRLQPRPYRPKKDPAAAEAFKKTSRV